MGSVQFFMFLPIMQVVEGARSAVIHSTGLMTGLFSIRLAHDRLVFSWERNGSTNRALKQPGYVARSAQLKTGKPTCHELSRMKTKKLEALCVDASAIGLAGKSGPV